MGGGQNERAAILSGVVRAAVVQSAPVWFDTPKSLAKLADLADDAARQRAELVVFPEAFIGGYPKGHDFGVSVGIRSPEGREEFRRLFDSAIDVPGPATESLGSVARRHALHLVVGVVEREGGTLYCSALLFGPDGELLAKHRKLMPTAMERVIWGSGDGSTLSVVATPLGQVGSVICWENYMPLLRTAMYGKGIEFYCAITVDDRETWIPTVRHIALEGRCFVLSACQFLPSANLAARRSWPASHRRRRTVDPRGELHRGAHGANLGWAEVWRAVHTLSRPGSGRAGPSEVRLRRRGPLRAARRFSAGSERAADESGHVSLALCRGSF